MTKDNKTDNNKAFLQTEFENAKAHNIPDEISDIFLDKLLSKIKNDSYNIAQGSHDKVKSSIMDRIKQEPQTKIPPLHIVDNSEIISFNSAKSGKPNYKIQSFLAMTSLAASLMLGVFFGISDNMDPYINTTLEIAGLSIEEESSLIDIIDNSNS